MTEPTLAEWLLEAIAEDEADAREHLGSQEWVQEAAGWWDCDRVIAECAAKCAIVAAALAYIEFDSGEWAFDLALRHLAVPYSGRPGFREEWTA